MCECVRVSVLELVSRVSPYVMSSVIASFFAVATAGGKAQQQQQHGAAKRSEQASATNRPAGASEPSKQ